MYFAARFEEGHRYGDFLTRYGNDDQRGRWQKFHQQVELLPAQRALLASFKRQMKELCLAGAWCGDCVNQCPIFDHFANNTAVIDLRFFDRDANPDLAAELKICGGARVPGNQGGGRQGNHRAPHVGEDRRRSGPGRSANGPRLP